MRDLAAIRGHLDAVAYNRQAARTARDKAMGEAARADRDVLYAERRIVTYDGEIDALLDELNSATLFHAAEAVIRA